MAAGKATLNRINKKQEARKSSCKHSVTLGHRYYVADSIRLTQSEHKVNALQIGLESPLISPCSGVTLPHICASPGRQAGTAMPSLFPPSLPRHSSHRHCSLHTYSGQTTEGLCQQDPLPLPQHTAPLSLLLCYICVPRFQTARSK